MRHRKAFTLIEMLVVITIIGILVALMIPAISAFKKTGRNAAIKTQMGSIQTALSAYGSDHRSEIPPSYGTAQPMFGLGTNQLTDWSGAEMLAQALVGPLPEVASGGIPGDGKSLGFKAPGGKSSGPYLELKEGTIRARGDRDVDGILDMDEFWVDPEVAEPYEGRHVISMPYSRTGRPFLYYRAYYIEEMDNDFRGGGMHPPVWSDGGRFRPVENEDLYDTATVDPIFKWKRDVAYSPDPTEPSREHSEREGFAMQLRGSQFLLVSPGADDQLGTEDDIAATGNAPPR